jgi:two-component system, OmpR family, phosphate regulon sensor histidine kinase PhoR
MMKEFDSLPKPIQTRLEHLERVRQDFVANVSHELRTPLTVIRGYLEALLARENEWDPELKKIFSQMYQHSIRMENLVSGLLLLSRLENDDQDPPAQQIVDVPNLLELLEQDAQTISRDLGRDHYFIFDVDPTLRLEGVEEELKSLFSNLIINAIRYTPIKGTITIRWFSNKGGPVFEVEDTGIGIPSEHIPRLTERFYRVDKARSRENGSTGLGLAIVKHVLLRHEGELQINSQVDKGSRFTCLFPAKRLRVVKENKKI